MRQAILDGSLSTQIICVDPVPRLEVKGMADEFYSQAVEKLSAELFDDLKAGDILFIDSSHRILTGNDVAFLYLKILPRLVPGVFIHIHDIFTPFHYPIEWIRERRMWNEQYLLEAFLSYNDSFEIMTANNFLKQFHYASFAEACPVFKKQKEQGVGSFWIRKIK